LPLVDDVQLGAAPRSEPLPISDSPSPATGATPVWEVDRFHWPRTCEKLLADQSGYLAGAGEKLVAAARDGLRTLAITGSRRGEGRTTLSLCLARAAAKAGIHVALLDADFARPSLASRLGLEIAHGWQDAALGHIPLSEAAVKSLSDNITVLPLEITSARRSLSLSDPRVTATLRAAAATFELVIVDLGPLGPGEGVVFPAGEKCPLDAAIVVRDLRFASEEESQDVGERLCDAGIEAVGVAENFVAEEELASA
jgi:Mrp family chromosome partitioning ATPase